MRIPNRGIRAISHQTAKPQASRTGGGWPAYNLGPDVAGEPRLGVTSLQAQIRILEGEQHGHPAYILHYPHNRRREAQRRSDAGHPQPHAPTEDLIVLSGFAFETKVIAVTGDRVVITKDDGNPKFSHYLASMQPARRDDRTLILKIAETVDHKFHMGQDEWATQLVDLINSQRNIVLNKQEPATGGSNPGVHSTSSQDAPAGAVEDTSLDGQDVSIAEKVQFWQEQDRINQELIPRVIRQSELLAQHVGEHENLPLIAAQAVSNALKEAREEIAALLEAAKAERQEQAHQLVNAKAEREEQNRQHEAERNKLVQEAQAERGAQARQHQAQLAGLKTKADQMRNLAIGASAVATVTGITAIILAILT